ncbi:MAG: hypothetical protein QM610_06195 [Chitinophagaceae bacterium]
MMQYVRDWQKIWWSMAEGDQARYETVKATEENEFYNLFNIQKEELKKRRAKNGR